jgi:hypothetical protein
MEKKRNQSIQEVELLIPNQPHPKVLANTWSRIK